MRHVKKILLSGIIIFMSVIFCSPLFQKNEPVPEPETDKNYTINYTVDSSFAGHIEGETSQTLQKGKTAATVKAVADNKDFVFVSWSDGKSTEFREGDTAEENTTYTAYFKSRYTEIPVMSLTTNGGIQIKSKTDYISGSVSLFGAKDAKYNLSGLTMQIRGRGNSTWEYFQKKSYHIKLDSKKQLLGIGDGADKDWLLLANPREKSFLRNWAMWEFAKKLDGIPYTTSCDFVELYINGSYAGLYCLCEQVEEGKYRVQINDDAEVPENTDYLIELNARVEADEIYFTNNKNVNGDALNYVIKNKDITAKQKLYVQMYFSKVDRAFEARDYKSIAALVDIDSLIDMYILQEFAINRDCGHLSFYYYKKGNGKLYFTAPWDFDLALGNDAEYNSYKNSLLAAKHNRWYAFIRGCSWWKEAVAKRFKEVMPLISQVAEDTKLMGNYLSGAADHNFTLWKIMGKSQLLDPPEVTKITTYSGQVDYLVKWMEDRSDWMSRNYLKF